MLTRGTEGCGFLLQLSDTKALKSRGTDTESNGGTTHGAKLDSKVDAGDAWE